MKLKKSKFLKLIKEYLTQQDVEDVAQTAQLVHLGQKRRDDTPYITHPIAVHDITRRYYPDDSAAQALSMLHDTLEDAEKVGNMSRDETYAMIQASIHDKQVLEMINQSLAYLTHDKSVPYDVYLQAALNDELAGKVKVSDLIHNLSHNPSPRQIIKYKTALDNVIIPRHISRFQLQHLRSILSRK